MVMNRTHFSMGLPGMQILAKTKEQGVRDMDAFVCRNGSTFPFRSPKSQKNEYSELSTHIALILCVCVCFPCANLCGLKIPEHSMVPETADKGICICSQKHPQITFETTSLTF